MFHLKTLSLFTMTLICRWVKSASARTVVPVAIMGIKSIIACLGTQDFVRIRVESAGPSRRGINKEETIVDYVLGDFTVEDKPVIEENHPPCQRSYHLSAPLKVLDNAMNKFN